MRHANWQRHFRAIELLVILLAIARFAQSLTTSGWHIEALVAAMAIASAGVLLYFSTLPERIFVALRLALISIWLACITWHGWFSIDAPLRGYADQPVSFGSKLQLIIDWPSVIGGTMVYVIVVAASVHLFCHARVGFAQCPETAPFPGQSKTMWLLVASAILFVGIAGWELGVQGPSSDRRLLAVVALLTSLHLSSLAAQHGSRFGLGMAFGEAILTPLLSLLRG